MMKSIFLTLFMAVLSVITFAQDKVRTDPSYSAYNYKHPNKAAYAKKHNLDNPARAGQIEVAQADNYKQSHRKTISTKFGVISRYDKYKIYPNYKHQGR
mgnify:CR=1 FL=1